LYDERKEATVETAFTNNPEFWQTIVVSLLCGALIGFERQFRGKPAGIRTSILICTGTSLFVFMGSMINGVSVDASRILGQVITGIGFLGAGVMFSREGVVNGVTTASVIWMLAAIGSLNGLGQWQTAIAVAVLTVTVLATCEFLERRFQAMRQGAHARKIEHHVHEQLMKLKDPHE